VSTIRVLDYFDPSPELFFYLGGDHLQLPPVVLNDEAKRRGYGISILERLAALTPDRVTLLRTQYRAHKDIADWSSAYFYRRQVKSHPSVASRILTDLPGVKQAPETTSPLLFIDTSDEGFKEEQDPFNDGSDEDSVANFEEVR
jgi:superfamily I DNA and/or RNA helicase